MNKRAIELYTEASNFAYNMIGKEHAGAAFFQGVVAGRFAELLIAECAKVCKEFGERGDGNICSVEILKHFGVKSENI